MVPFSENALYNLYSKAFKAAGFEACMKQHLPRHLLAYQKELQGKVLHNKLRRILNSVSDFQHSQTEKLGWERGKTFSTTYSVQIPKQAVLGCAGYKD